MTYVVAQPCFGSWESESRCVDIETYLKQLLAKATKRVSYRSRRMSSNPPVCRRVRGRRLNFFAEESKWASRCGTIRIGRIKASSGAIPPPSNQRR